MRLLLPSRHLLLSPPKPFLVSNTFINDMKICTIGDTNSLTDHPSFNRIKTDNADAIINSSNFEKNYDANIFIIQAGDSNRDVLLAFLNRICTDETALENRTSEYLDVVLIADIDMPNSLVDLSLIEYDDIAIHPKIDTDRIRIGTISEVMYVSDRGLKKRWLIETDCVASIAEQYGFEIKVEQMLDDMYHETLIDNKAKLVIPEGTMRMFVDLTRRIKQMKEEAISSADEDENIIRLIQQII